MKKVLDAIGTGEVTAYYLHLAEGMRDNERSQKEFDLLVELGALTAATVIIHGTALTRDQLGQAKDAGARLVWSPQSNLRLYGETTRAADALDVGLPVALGADWLPSGLVEPARGDEGRPAGAGQPGASDHARSSWSPWSPPAPRTSPGWGTSSAASRSGGPPTWW